MAAGVVSVCRDPDRTSANASEGDPGGLVPGHAGGRAGVNRAGRRWLAGFKGRCGGSLGHVDGTATGARLGCAGPRRAVPASSGRARTVPVSRNPAVWPALSMARHGTCTTSSANARSVDINWQPLPSDQRLHVVPGDLLVAVGEAVIRGCGLGRRRGLCVGLLVWQPSQGPPTAGTMGSLRTPRHPPAVRRAAAWPSRAPSRATRSCLPLGQLSHGVAPVDRDLLGHFPRSFRHAGGTRG